MARLLVLWMVQLGIATAMSLSGATRVLPSLVSHRIAARPLRVGATTMGFEVESMEKQALDELNVLNWPGLEKRTSDFTKSAAADELLMVYVKEGSATVAEGDESAAVAQGQIVMVQDGEVRWTDVGEGVTLLSVVTALETLDGPDLEDERNMLKAQIAKSLTGSTRGLSGGPSAEGDEEVSLKEYAALLAAGLVSGGLLSFGLKLLQEP